MKQVKWNKSVSLKVTGSEKQRLIWFETKSKINSKAIAKQNNLFTLKN